MYTEELDTINYISKHFVIKEGSEVNLICKSWYKSWLEYTKNGGKVPLPISNDKITEENLNLKQNLDEKNDFTCIPSLAWRTLKFSFFLFLFLTNFFGLVIGMVVVQALQENTLKYFLKNKKTKNTKWKYIFSI